MAKNNINNKKGFTIIEVVLVLAIAGLIFLMVFVALPALQRSQRDTQRRNDMSRVDTSLSQYQTNHSNQTNNLPSAGKQDFSSSGNNFPDGCSSNSACTFVRDYMNTGSSENDGKDNNFQDPDGVAYSLVITCNWGESSCTNPSNQSNIGTSQLSAAKASDGTDGYTIANLNGQSFDAHVVYIVPGGRCIGDVVAKSSTRHFAILYRLEGAGTYCIDDQ
ncbi:type II secretion system protein [Candidatus Saccharibacteria bacterium]|nr:type II secretion system protein [Candidatus Saccharibacteria bacterium]